MKRRSCFVWVALLALSVPVFAEDAQTAQQTDMAEMMKAMGALMSGGTNAAAVVDFRQLKALLPETVGGLKRAHASGEKNGALGMTVATAEGVYDSESGALTIKISDNGGMGGLMTLAQAGWAAGDFERETDTGFDRTTQYGEYKAHEQYDTSAKSGEIQVLVAGRFLVEVNGSNLPWETLQAAAKAIDFAKLAALKPADKPAQ